MTDSNANTSGLEVVAWRWRFRTDGVWNYQEAQQRIPDVTCEPLVTAASAQARIDAAEARADRLAKALMTARDYVSDAAEGHAWTASQVAELMRGNRPDNRQAGDDLASIDAALQQETQP